MNGRNDDQVVLLRNVLHERNDLERGGRVKTRSGLVKEEELRAGDELRSNTDTTLLTTGNTLPDGSADQVVGLALKTESSQERLDALNALELADVAGQRKARGEVQGLADGERTDERIFLLDVRRDAAESLGVGRRAVDVDGGLDRSVERRSAVREDVEKGRLAGTTACDCQ